MPTTTSGSFDLAAILRSLGGLVNPQIGNTLGTIGSVAQPILGAGLIGAGLAQKEEPGYATDAIQYLRNQLTSPTAIGDVVGQNVQSLYGGFQPLLQQQSNEALNNAQQRIIAGQPSSFSTAMSGPEVLSIRNAISRDILPRQQSLMNELALNVLNHQQQAAGSLLNYAKPDPLGGLLTALGTGMLGGSQQGGGLMGAGQQGGLGQSLMNMFGSNTSMGDAISQAVGLANTSGDLTKLSALLSSGVLRGVPFPIGLQASTPAGQLIQQAINAGLVESPAATAVGGATSGGVSAFLASSLGSLLGAAGIAAGGYGIGQLASNLGQNQFQSSAGGALGGAAAGALAGTMIFPGIGTAIGALIGGLGGLFGGLFGEQSEQQQIKDARREADIAGNTGKTEANGSFFLQQLQQLGVDTSAYQQFIQQQVGNAAAGEEPFSFQGISGVADQSYAVAIVGGKLLLQTIQQQNPSITSLAQVPGLRESFINQMLGYTFQGEGTEGGHLPLSDINVTSGFGGLLGPGNYSSGGSQYQWMAKGGLLRPGGRAIVGEHGMESVHMTPYGALIRPLSLSHN